MFLISLYLKAAENKQTKQAVTHLCNYVEVHNNVRKLLDLTEAENETVPNERNNQSNTTLLLNKTPTF